METTSFGFAASLLFVGVPTIFLIGLFISTSDGCIKLQLCDREDPTGNVYAQRIKGETTGDYELYMKMDNVRLAYGNYDVRVSNSLITEWKHKDLNLKYYIALEP